MKIVQIPDISIPSQAAPAPTPVPAAPDLSRVEALERIAKSILQKIQDIEERIKTLEEMPKNSSFPAAIGGESINHDGPPTETLGGDEMVVRASPITFDSDAVKKGLLTKMWKYLNDAA